MGGCLLLPPTEVVSVDLERKMYKNKQLLYFPEDVD